MRLAVLAMVLILADHFFFEGHYREAAWLEVRGLGDPINAVVWMANTLARYDERLRAGQYLVTGLCTRAPVPLATGDVNVRAEFTRLGTVSIKLAR